MKRADEQTTNIINVATRLPEVEKFSNGPSAETTFSEWTDNYELNCQALSIPQENWGKILPLYLTEGALITYRNIIARNPTIKEDYNILTAELAEEFAVTDGIANSVDLNNRVKQESESVGKYYASITTMAKRLFPTMNADALDQIILSSFVRGLPVTFKRGLLNNPSITTADLAFKAAQRMEKTNAILLNESAHANISAVNRDIRLEEQMEAMKQSLKNLELREAERVAESRHGQDNNNNWYRQAKNYSSNATANPNWRDRRWNKPMGRQFHGNYKNGQAGNYPGRRFDNRWRNQRNANFLRAPQWQPWRQNQMQTAREHHRQHVGQEFTMDGRPICRNCNGIGHQHYFCRAANSTPEGQMTQQNRMVRFRDIRNQPRAVNTLSTHKGQDTNRTGGVNNLSSDLHIPTVHAEEKPRGAAIEVEHTTHQHQEMQTAPQLEIEQTTLQPQKMQKTHQSQNEQTTLQPQIEQTTLQPQVEQPDLETIATTETNAVQQHKT
ncbi:putative mediator of RNA polymerase II transcription subunit 29 [Watersipora subatra]|uniref:putative mediator of RNA polymerase II transcription subunit 29 n=1 Tax=Watersipora subatra TaxID=2589382 RepID=UPI00355C201F